MDPKRRRFPTTYFTPPSGIGLTFEAFPRWSERRIGVVGLGVGTLATYSLRGDYMRIYEINSDVLRMATDHFTFLADSEARVEVILGDARLSMERESPQAFEIYRRHLKPDGVIAIHFTSRYFDLEPVLRQVAEHFEMEAAYIFNDDGSMLTYRSDWMLLSNNEEFLNTGTIAKAAWREPQSDKRIRLWTDDYSNLFQVLAF